MDNRDIEKNNEKKAKEIKTATRTNLFQRLAVRFGFGVKKASKEDQSSVFLVKKPTKDQLNAKNTKEEVDLISNLFKGGKLSSTIEDLFQYWINDTQNTYRNIDEREERLNSLTYMCDNEGLVKNAVTLVASEVASLTENNAFTVICEDENWQKEKNILLKNVWHYDKTTIYSLAWDIFLYGEAFQGVEMSSAGVVNITTLKPNEILERVEFKPSEVMNFQAQMQSNNYSTGFSVNLTMPTNGTFAQNNLSFENTRQINYKSSNELLKDYIDNLADISSTEYFTSHLIGFRLANDTLVAPWQVIHFRYNEHVSEFWPYGQPPLISCLSAYKQLQRVMGLDDLKTLLGMPIYMYKVKTNGATTARAFDIVNDVKEDFENVGLMSTSAGIEGPSLCTNIWTSDDLVSIEKVNGESNSDSGATDKMKFFYNRLSSSTGIPLTYLDPTADGFQMSGVALATLYRPFKTMIDNIRAIIIKEVEDRIRLHDSIRNVKTPDFVLSMNVENPVDKDDMNSKFNLVDKVLEEISNLLGIESNSLPQQIKKDILMKYANLSQEELEKYIQLAKTEKEMKVEEPEASQSDVDGGFGDDLSSDSENGSYENEEYEEAFIKDKRRKLIEAKYKNLSQNQILYKLTETFGKVDLPKRTLDFSTNYNSKINQEVASFMKEKVSLKKGKKKLSN